MTLVKLDHFGECVLGTGVFSGRAGDQQLAGLPHILMIILDHGDVEFFMQPRQDWFDVPALLLEGMAIR